ncbi:MAG: D-glycero-beta-D-manno-heptose-7-phosphate kinase [Cyclobacteriaceae bacterium]|nr:D-glycero-beta-D-manno-heptose-7-phosphate kinase [Cyclobacteriaceae bacterium]
MQSWPDIFSGFNNLNVLIIGDVMVDAYTWGAVERISPEAPVPIINVVKRDYRLGGAANVGLNILALGAKPILCSLIGDDDNGKKLLDLLDEKGMSKEGIVKSSTRPTTVKTRVIAAHQHVVRIDEESDAVATDKEEAALLERINKLIVNCQVVIFEDYDKGVITPKMIDAVVKLAKSKNIPTVVDPKKRNFLHYNNVTLFKPNLKELREGLKVDIDAREESSIHHAVEQVRKKLGVEGVMLTLSEHGVFIVYKDQTLKLKAHKRSIADVSGAGDTVISIAALCVALQLSPEKIAALSNLGGGLVCQQEGVVPIDKEELLREASGL